MVLKGSSSQNRLPPYIVLIPNRFAPALWESAVKKSGWRYPHVPERDSGLWREKVREKWRTDWNCMGPTSKNGCWSGNETIKKPFRTKPSRKV